jgi:alkylation response protein AidB-like acyl-CoA dehydrogenase
LCALDYAINFLKQRSFRGQPMSSMQGLRWMVSDMATDLEAARCLIYECASQLDAGVPVDRIVRLSSMAKLVATESAVRVAGDALQLMGGAGYMTEHPVERYLRDAKATTIYEGTSQIQKNTIAASILDETARTG